MTQGITQEYILPGTKYMTVRVTVAEEYDLQGNRSDVTVAVEAANSVYSGHVYYLTGTLSAEGAVLQTMDAVAGSHNVYIGDTDAYYPITGSPYAVTGILHNNDGTKILSLGISLKGITANGRGANGWTVEGNLQVPLTAIPRASEIGATDANIGAVSMIAVSKKNSAYTHSIAWSFGELSGYLASDGSMTEEEVRFSEASIPFRLPESFYDQIPDAKSGPCTLTCRTYNGQTQVGDAKQAAFTATASPELCGPVLTATVADCNEQTLALTGDENILVRYRSDALCTMTVQARKGASIVLKTIGGEAVTEDSRTIPGIPVGEVLFAVTDSRGYTAAMTVAREMTPYRNLTCNCAARRTDPVSGDAELTVSGECYNGAIGDTENTLTLRCRVGEGEWLTLEPQFDGHTYGAQALLTGLHYAGIHTVEVEAADCLSAVTRQTQVNKGIPVFDWGEEDFTFHVPVRFLGGFPASITSGDITEWIAPPMELGVEYRTIQRHMGKPVYTALIDCGFFPASGTRSQEHGKEAANILQVAGYTDYFGCALPYFDDSEGTVVSAEVAANQNVVILRTTTDNWTTHRCYVRIWYTKE